MAVVELRQLNALTLPDIQILLKNAVESGALLAPNGFDTVAADMIEFVRDPNQFMFLGAEAGKFRGVVMGYLPVENLFPYPTVVLFYNEGSRKLSREMQDALLDFLMSRGYTRMLGVNSSGKKDDVWLKGMTPEGALSYITGSLVMFEVE